MCTSAIDIQTVIINIMNNKTPKLHIPESVGENVSVRRADGGETLLVELRFDCACGVR